MQYEHDDAGEGVIVHTPISESDVETFRDDGQAGTFKVSIGDTDIPAFVSSGKLYLQAPLGLFFEAFAEDLPAFIRDMEIRISDARGTPFSLDSNGRPVSLAGLAIPSLVPNRWRGRRAKPTRWNSGRSL